MAGEGGAPPCSSSSSGPPSHDLCSAPRCVACELCRSLAAYVVVVRGSLDIAAFVVAERALLKAASQGRLVRAAPGDARHAACTGFCCLLCKNVSTLRMAPACTGMPNQLMNNAHDAVMHIGKY